MYECKKVKGICTNKSPGGMIGIGNKVNYHARQHRAINGCHKGKADSSRTLPSE